MKYFSLVAFSLLMGFAASLFAQEPTGTMDILRDKIQADKKLLVSINMNLSEEESGAFWPVYDSYQRDLEAINARISDLILAYAEAFTANSIDEDTAKALVDEMIAIEKAEAELKEAYVPRLVEAVPMVKVARYIQLENKIRALVKFDLAAQIPLVHEATTE